MNHQRKQSFDKDGTAVISSSDFTKTLASDPGTFSNPQRSRKVLEVEKKIREIIAKNGQIAGVEGIFGDARGCSAYLDDGYPKVTKDGWVSKFVGCSYEYKGLVDAHIIDQVATVKRALIRSIFLVYQIPFLVLLYAWRKTVLHWFLEIYAADLEKYELKFEQFSPAQREMLKFLLGAFRSYGEDGRRFSYCLMMFLHFDNAYWQPLQDALSEAGYEGSTFREVMDVIVERERYGAIIEKFKVLRKIVLALSWFPPFRKMERKFFEQVDFTKLCPDEADWYFMLNRRGYDFGGLSFEKRYLEFEKINGRKGHVILGI